MISTKAQIVTTLKSATNLDVLYELISETAAKPVITYSELGNFDDENTVEYGYSKIRYRIKLWVDKVADIETYANKIDYGLRSIGGTRTNTNELTMGSQICKIFDYQFLAFEKYSNE